MDGTDLAEGTPPMWGSTAYCVKFIVFSSLLPFFAKFVTVVDVLLYNRMLQLRSRWTVLYVYFALGLVLVGLCTLTGS